MRIHNIKHARPLTHDLCRNLIVGLGATLRRVQITHVENSTYFAELHLEIGNAVKVIDARPSDSIAVALRMDAPIFADESLLSDPDEDEAGETVESPQQQPNEGTRLSAEQLKSYLEKLRPEDFGDFKLYPSRRDAEVSDLGSYPLAGARGDDRTRGVSRVVAVSCPRCRGDGGPDGHHRPRDAPRRRQGAARPAERPRARPRRVGRRPSHRPRSLRPAGFGADVALGRVQHSLSRLGRRVGDVHRGRVVRRHRLHHGAAAPAARHRRRCPDHRLRHHVAAVSHSRRRPALRRHQSRRGRQPAGGRGLRADERQHADRRRQRDEAGLARAAAGRRSRTFSSIPPATSRARP